jgi:hypothetical protein
MDRRDRGSRYGVWLIDRKTCRIADAPAPGYWINEIHLSAQLWLTFASDFVLTF